MPAPTQAQLTTAGKQAIKDTVAALTALGKLDLVNATQSLDRWAPAVARGNSSACKPVPPAATGSSTNWIATWSCSLPTPPSRWRPPGCWPQAERERVGTLLSLIGKMAIGAGHTRVGARIAVDQQDGRLRESGK